MGSGPRKSLLLWRDRVKIRMRTNCCWAAVYPTCREAPLIRPRQKSGVIQEYDFLLPDHQYPLGGLVKGRENMRVFYVGIVVIACLFCTGVFATTRCVKLSAPTVCSTSADCYNTSDCTVDCDGVSTIVVGRCASTSGTADTSVATNISTSTTNTNNLNCWCALVSPVASKWVMRYVYTSATQCAYNCGRGCRNAMIFNNDMDVSFRTTLYSNILE